MNLQIPPTCQISVMSILHFPNFCNIAHRPLNWGISNAYLSTDIDVDHRNYLLVSWREEKCLHIRWHRGIMWWLDLSSPSPLNKTHPQILTPNSIPPPWDGHSHEQPPLARATTTTTVSLILVLSTIATPILLPLPLVFSPLLPLFPHRGQRGCQPWHPQMTHSTLKCCVILLIWCPHTIKKIRTWP